MAKLKPEWMKTDIPKDTKIKLWGIMRDCPTYSAWDKYITSHEKLFDKAEYDWLPRSRATHKALQDEINEMPIEEVRSLPSDLQIWIQQLRPELQIISADEFLARYGNKLDPATRLILQTTKPNCQLAITPQSEETVVTFGETTPQKYADHRLQRLERIKKLCKESPNPIPPIPYPSPDMHWDVLNQRWVNIDEYAKEKGYRVVEENGRKFIDGGSVIAKYIEEQDGEIQLKTRWPIDSV